MSKPKLSGYALKRARLHAQAAEEYGDRVNGDAMSAAEFERQLAETFTYLAEVQIKAERAERVKLEEKPLGDLLIRALARWHEVEPGDTELLADRSVDLERAFEQWVRE